MDCPRQTLERNATVLGLEFNPAPNVREADPTIVSLDRDIGTTWNQYFVAHRPLLFAIIDWAFGANASAVGFDAYLTRQFLRQGIGVRVSLNFCADKNILSIVAPDGRAAFLSAVNVDGG